MTTKVVFRGEDLSSYANDLSQVERCVLCQSKTNTKWSSDPHPFHAVKCSDCGFVWMQTQPGEDTLKKYYSDYIGQRRINNSTKMQQRKVQYAEDKSFLQHYAKEGRILDVGCNGGFFLDCLDDAFEKYGVEVDEVAVKYAHDNFDFGKNVCCGDILEADFPEESFDVIVMRGTIEHVIKPVEVIARCSELLKPGGIFYITATPNVDSLAAEIFRDRWSIFHPVQHLWYFSPKTMTTICERFGMTFVSATYPYLGTVYEDHKSDLAIMLDEVAAQKSNTASNQISPPFYESLMSIIFKKL